jgi:uncharacterized protein YbjT (DUF2867 family)
MGTDPIRVAVAGATGFVGRRLCALLCSRGFAVTGLGRGVHDGARQDGVLWRRADLFSLLDCERTLEGVDVVYYLIHSMMPSAKLTQARFEDMDLILADNVARAAALGGARRIIYLGGLVPNDPHLSRHLESRHEVEAALGAHGVPVTTLRAGLVIGPEGSSFRILERLVRRLPSMMLPRWTRQQTQPIALDDVVDLLVRVLEQDAAVGEAIDVGGPDVLTYRELIERTAAAMGVERRLVDVPVGTPMLSELWVAAVTGLPRELAGPLIESLSHTMTCSDRSEQLRLGVPGVSMDAAIKGALAGSAAFPEVTIPRKEQSSPSSHRVRSVQRMMIPQGHDAAWAAQAYLDWLPRFLRPLLRVDRDGQRHGIILRGVDLLLLELTGSPERSSPGRVLLYVTGGALARVSQSPRGRLELRCVLGGDTLLAAIHDFVPSLPWPVYLLTQAQAHLIVMAGYRRYLARLMSGG